MFDALGRGLDTLKGWFRTTVDEIGRTWNRVKSLVATPIRFVVDTVYNKGIKRAWNAVAGFLNMDDKKLANIELGELSKYATGGVLPGYTPGRDPHQFYSPTGGRLALSGGEAIMRPEWTRAVGGPAAVERMNRAARSGKLSKRYKDAGGTAEHANGGVFQAFANGGVWQSLWRAVSTAFPNATLNSEYRPGHSGYHGRGQAVDIGGPMQQVANWIYKKYPDSAQLIWGPGPLLYNVGGNKISDQNQLRNQVYAADLPGHYDHVHWASDGPITSDGKMVSMDGGSSGGGGFFDFVAKIIKPAWDGVINKIPKFTETKGWAAEVPGKFLPKAAGAMWDWIKEKASSVFGGGGGGNIDTSGVAGTNIQIGQELAKRAGWVGSEWEALKQLWHNESGWNNHAQNPTSTAYGIPQFLDSTWADVGYQKTSDPATQIAAGIKYIKQRPDYAGSPSRALSLWQSRSPHWYDNGGYLKPGTTEVRNDTGKPEPVFTAEQWAVLRGNILTNAQAQNWQGIAKDLKTIARGYQKWWATSDEAKQLRESAQKSAEDAAVNGAKSALAPYGLDPAVDIGLGVGKRVQSAWDASGMDVGVQGRSVVVNIEAEEGQDRITIDQLQKLEKEVDWLKVNVNRKPKASVTTRGGVM